MQGPPATLEDVSQLQRRLDALTARVGTSEEAVGQWSKTIEETDKATRQSRADQSVLIEDLRTELKSLRNDLEVTQYDFKKSQEEQKKFKEDLDLRLTDLEQKSRSSVVAAVPGGTRKPSRPASPEDEMLRYNQIRALLEKKEFDQAIAQFQEFLKEYPDGRYASNAQYWLAEAYYSKRDFPTAITEFQKVIDKYPKSDKVCDSLLKQGFGFAELKDAAKAKLFLTDTKDRCKGTPAGTKAQKRLADLAATPVKQ